MNINELVWDLTGLYSLERDKDLNLKKHIKRLEKKYNFKFLGTYENEEDGYSKEFKQRFSFIFDKIEQEVC